MGTHALSAAFTVNAGYARDETHTILETLDSDGHINARHHARRVAKRSAVACMPLLGGF
jgi:hypothetical protein